MFRTKLRAGIRGLAANAVRGSVVARGAVGSREVAGRTVIRTAMRPAAVLTPNVERDAVGVTATASTIGSLAVSATTETDIQEVTIVRSPGTEADIQLAFQVDQKTMGAAGSLYLEVKLYADASVLRSFTANVPVYLINSLSNYVVGGPFTWPWLDTVERVDAVTYKVTVESNVACGVALRYLRVWERKK